MEMARKPKVLIFTEGSEKIGWGHLSRCISLAKVLDQHFSVLVYIDGSIPNWLKCDVEYQVGAWKKHIEYFDVPNTVFVFDSYSLTQQCIYQIENNTQNTCIFIDDYHHFHYKKSIIIDWTPRDKIQKNSKHIIGLNYCILRPEFIKHEHQEYPFYSKKILCIANKNSINNSDHYINLLHKINQIGYSLILLGNFFSLKNSDLSNDIKPTYTAQDLCDLQNEVLLTLSPGGQTLYEIISLGIPCIAYTNSENQMDDLLGFYDLGLIELLTDQSQLHNEVNLQQIQKQASDREKLKLIHKKMIQCIDRKGGERICKKILEVISH